MHRLRRLADTKAQLTKLDKRQLAKVDEACAEIEANSKLLVLIQEDLTHVFLRVRHAYSDTSLCAVAQQHHQAASSLLGSAVLCRALTRSLVQRYPEAAALSPVAEK